MAFKISKESRSKLAAARLRDRNGRFAFQGGRHKPDPKPRKAKITKENLEASLKALKKANNGKITKDILGKALAELKGATQGVRNSALGDAKKALEALPTRATLGASLKKLKGEDKAKVVSALNARLASLQKPKETKEPLKFSKEDKLTIPTPGAKKVTKASNVAFTDKGIEIWQGNKNAKFDPTFKVRYDRKYNYEVTVDGKQVSLNRNRNVFIFQGETVKGVPPLHPHLREMEDKQLFRALTNTMSQAESSKPSAPQWSPGLHGQVNDVKWTYDLGDKNGGRVEGYYGGMQIHHVGQWAKRDLETFNKDVLEGRIGKDEAKKIRDEISFTETFKEKGETKQKLSIKVLPSDQREFVMLPAGIHDSMSSLFRANHHPYLINPETMKLNRIGIPNSGMTAESGSRDWFNAKFKPKFFKELYRRESYVLRQEVNRRVAKGALSVDDAKRLWAEVHSEASGN